MLPLLLCDRLLLIPIDLRLKNPPPDFVGRADAMHALLTALRAGPCIEVYGPAGIGKSALVQRALGQRRSKKPPLCVSIPADHAWAPHLADGLARALGQPPPAHAASEQILELAEAGGWWIVVEDAQHIEPTDRARLLQLIADHARRSRWILVGWQCTPGCEAVARLPMLGLPEPALQSLLTRRLQVPQSTVDRAIRLGGGSPGATLHIARLDTDPWTVDAATEPSAMQLALVERPLPMDFFSRPPTALLRRGWATQNAQGVCAHPTAQAAWRARWRDALLEQVVPTAQALLADRRAVLKIEGLRLLGSVPVLTALRVALAQHCDTLLADHHALALWQAIGRVSGIDRWRLRVAAELGTPEALAWLPTLPPAELEDRYWWAMGWLMRGNPARAFDVVDAIADQHLPAGLLAASCLMNLGRFIEAEQRLAQHPDRVPWTIRRAVCLVQLDRFDAARTLALAAQTQALAVMQTLHSTDMFELARVLIDLGELNWAEAWLDRVPPDQAGRGAAAARLARHHIADLRGRFDQADRLRQSFTTHSGAGLFGPSVEGLRLQSDLMSGALKDFAGRLRRLKHAVEQTDLPRHYYRTFEADFGRINGTTPSTLPADLDGESGPHWMRWRARHGLTLPNAWRATPAQQAQTDLAEDEARLARNQPVGVISAIELARSADLGSIEAEALEVACEAALIARDHQRLTRLLDQLRPFGTTSLRYQGSIDFYVWALQPIQFGTLEHLALQMQSAPVAARRARVLLGECAPLDQIDQHVIRTLPRTQRLLPGDGPGWGINLADRTVWRPEGPPICLSSRPIAWRMLQTLAHANGAAQKDVLVAAIWDEDYHPLKHDNRLQAAVRALRVLIEHTPGQPKRLLTRPDGYALGAPCGLHGNTAP